MTIYEVNAITGEVINRKPTAEELQQNALDRQAELAKNAELEAKATQRQAILDRLGLTAEEAALLLGGN